MSTRAASGCGSPTRRRRRSRCWVHLREPYLRISPAGVDENLYSPSLALNQSLFTDAGPLDAPSLPPAWVHKSNARVVSWHDHRIHWMGASRPPKVAAHPDRGQLVGPWTIHLLVDGAPVTLSGTLNWLPMKSASPARLAFFVGINAVIVLGLALGAVVAWRRKRGQDALQPEFADGSPEDARDPRLAEELSMLRGMDLG